MSLLRSIGCTGNSHETAALLGGEDAVFLGLVQRLSGGDGREWIDAMARHVATTAPALAAVRDERWFATEGRLVGRAARDSACEVSTSLAARLGLPVRVRESLDHVYERWDGRGPGAIGGEAGAPAARRDGRRGGLTRHVCGVRRAAASARCGAPARTRAVRAEAPLSPAVPTTRTCTPRRSNRRRGSPRRARGWR